MNMLDHLIEKISESYPLKEVENADFSSFKVKGMTFEVKAYDARYLGRVSQMHASMPLGIMEMDTLIINPFELDAPLFSLDFIKAMGKVTLYLEQYDTLLKPDRKELCFEQIGRKYDHLEYAQVKGGWYDSIRYASCVYKKGKKSDLDQLKSLMEEYFDAYLDVCRDARVCDIEDKKVLADAYRDGLLNNGGVSTDAFLKEWGKEKTEVFFKEVLFG